ncbi:Hint domain-containing protein [Sulfitobacter mediterraneus]|uniref:Hint domain-containing protein n=1 Tax=Sulfitobacter mediterraneus TaxID=83219 RepID=UPI000EA0BCBE|nr:Hint domain-containing protein [Sulfitobacter mediterraneus]
MPTSYKDQFYTIDPGNPPASGTAVSFTRQTFTDANDDGLIQPNVGDTFEGTQVTSVWQNDSVTINVPGVGNVTYTGTTFYLAGGLPAVFTPTDGQVLQNGTFVSSTYVTSSTQMPVANTGPTCFTPGTMIQTPDGDRLIEGLKVGDLVNTADHGAQPIRYILRGTFRAAGDVAPIRFSAGSIGNDAPLTVSPQHRMLITGWQAEMFFGVDEVLVAAKHLVNGDTIRQVTGGMVEYIHLVFDQHELVFGQGVPSESFFPGHVRDMEDQAARDELLMLFPDAADLTTEDMQTARCVLRGHDAQILQGHPHLLQ